MPIPVTLSEAKDQLQIGQNDTDRDQEIVGYVEDAAAWVEEYTGHILAARDVTEHFNGFDKVDLRAWPVSPTAAPVVTYAGPPAEPIVVPAARMNISRRPARVLPALGLRWPLVASSTMVTVTVRAGYEDGETVPRNFRRAMLILISAYDADREGGDLLEKAQATARRLCGSFRNRTL